MIVAVVGAAGFLGGFIARHLAAHGHQVIAIGRGEPLPGRAVEALVDCNGDSRRFWANANPADSFRANVASVAERALAPVPAGRYVYMSTIDVYGAARADRARNGEDAPLSPAGLDAYGFHKLLAEQVVRFHAARPLILRLGTLIGPGLKKNPVHDAVTGAPIRQTPDSTLSLIDLDHVARTLLALLAADAEGVFNVTASRSVTVAELVAAAERFGARAGGYHTELMHTDYDIAVAKASRHIDLPDSAAMLHAYLAGAAAEAR